MDPKPKSFKNSLNPNLSSQSPKDLSSQAFVVEQSKLTPKLEVNEVVDKIKVENYK